jgi:hypothetical protein
MDWENWFYYNLVTDFSKEKGTGNPDPRDFHSQTTVEDEMVKRGYDGIIIKGREIVNFKPPSNVMYFSNERQLVNYYEQVNRFDDI